MGTVHQWALRTASSDYVVSLLPDGSGLILDHWGAQLDGIATWLEPERTLGYRFPADAAPLEYASAGDRQVEFSELIVDRGSALVGARWICLDPEDPKQVTFSADAGRSSLSVTFSDETGELQLITTISTTAEHDVVRRSIQLRNNSARAVTLPRAFSAGWALPVGQLARVHYLAGRWAHEFTPRFVEIHWGSLSLGSRQGVTGAMFSPVVAVESTVEGRRHEAYGIALEWSGSWRMNIESTSIGDRVRVSCGVDDETTLITLLPGESFSSPASVGVWSPAGPAGVSEAWHRYQRTSLTRSLDPVHRPVVYNSWYATEFDVDHDGQRKLAAVAAQLGVEVFVVDDGWFVGRSDDTAGLGDWTPDPAKFPHGLAQLADQVAAYGMRFGIWIEPEAVNPDSDLYRAHPEWVYRAGERPLVTVRNQYVLDLGRDEVVAWVEDTLRGLLDSASISYLKWDMNRPVSDGGRPGDVHGREWSVQHTRNYYRVLRMLRREYPHVTVEACAAGGARIDNAVLALCDVVWPSDETGPRDRLAIQHGYLSAYPAHAMSSWVTDMAGMGDRSAVSFGFRFVVAMAGVLGIGSDIVEWTEDERSRATELIALYKELRPLLHQGSVTRHGNPGDLPYAIEYALPTETSTPCCLLVYDRDRDRSRDQETVRVRPQSLDRSGRYRVRGTDTVVTGGEAASVGVPVEFRIAEDADVLIFDRVE
jgi:alpha-galactosidase